jgi:hypothetical protein
MSYRNLLMWNPDLRPQALGYDVYDGTNTTRASSNVFYDPTVFATLDDARAAVYTVTVVTTGVEGSPIDPAFDPYASVDLDVSRWAMETGSIDLCMLTGSILSASGTVVEPIEIRVSLHPYDLPVLVPSFGYLTADEVSFYANCRGEFSIPLVRQARVFVHIPSVHLHGLLIVPDDTTVDIKDVTFEPVDIRRNS